MKKKKKIWPRNKIFLYGDIFPLAESALNRIIDIFCPQHKREIDVTVVLTLMCSRN